VKTFLCAFCTASIAALAFYFLTLREISAIDPKGPGTATIKQLKEMNQIALKEPRATTTQLKEVSQIALKRPGVRPAKQLGQSPRRRELESAITRAERAVADAEDASQEDELGASERGYLASELKQMAVEERARAEASARRSKKTIREIHNAEAKAAKLHLEDLKAQLATVGSDE
jgi:hypothetical protein